ncbi:DUF3775 domain-containing protein [Nostoc sp. CALU 546]|uniref:DUF3775 domain-containing protein n=2 Tax=unclassified Nostoc TaxID=2593658 RepID=UPI003B676BFA
MNFLLISKVYEIIELAELIYCPKSSDILFGRVNIPETFLDKLSNYLEDFEMTGRTSIRVLHKYVDDFSSDEKGQVIALIWLGQYVSCEQPSDLNDLTAQALHLIPQNYTTSYIIEKAFLAKYLRSGLNKINNNHCNN